VGVGGAGHEGGGDWGGVASGAVMVAGGAREEARGRGGKGGGGEGGGGGGAGVGGG